MAECAGRQLMSGGSAILHDKLWWDAAAHVIVTYKNRMFGFISLSAKMCQVPCSQIHQNLEYLFH
jgi:ABC-type molybdate transport system ATPase subunit